MTNIVEVVGLRKEYRGRKGTTVAIDDLHFEIPGPGVYGFLGPNGAGKTTTIRCLLGLVRPTAGTAKLFDSDVTNDLGSVIARVGALVESPKFSPNLSAQQNLELFAQMGSVSRGRCAEVLELVELTDRADDTVASYSLGMKQRLAIAAALLRDPQLLILDEPSNGLDPAGISDMRRLIRRLGAEGRTVLVSSHQLSEIQQMCDHVIIVQNGHKVMSGTVAEIIDAASTKKVVVTIDDPIAAIACLAVAGFQADLNIETDEIVVVASKDQAAGINRTLAEAGLYLTGLRVDGVSLEEAFLAITQAESHTSFQPEAQKAQVRHASARR